MALQQFGETTSISKGVNVPVNYSNLPSKLIDRTKARYERNWRDEIVGPVEKSFILVGWEYGRWILLAVLLVLPFLTFSLADLSKGWIMSPLAFAVSCILSGGAPVAGGIIYIPVFRLLGVSTKQTIAFSAAMQAFGCGIFSPASWLAKDPGILIKSSFIVVIPANFLGLCVSMFLLPANEKAVTVIFAFFCFFLAVSVLIGLQRELTSQDEEVRIEFPPRNWRELKTFLVYVITGFIGGMVAGWIGIGPEKLFFLVATNYHKADVRRATVTGIALVGWLSIISAYFHFFVFQDVPMLYWLCGLPGLIVGTYGGPLVNAALGSRNVMIAFSCFLFVTSMRDILYII